ncbi:MAG: hypothetical protein ACRDK1_07100 [Solirubrobacterales bacterium]
MALMPFILTRVRVDEYGSWKPMFDQDPPGAREAARGHRLYRSVDDPNEVFVQVEFASSEEAKSGRDKLLASGILERFPDHTGPTVVEEAEAITY